MLSLRAAVRAGSVDVDARTVELTWTTGAKGRRWSWDVGSYMEELEVSEDAVRLDRLNNGAPFLNAHNSYELDAVIGVVEKAWIEGAEGRALVRFSQRDDVEKIFKDVQDGILRNISVGYAVHRYEVTESADDKLPTYRAVDWEPMEISLVPIGFDDGGKFRSANASEEYKGQRFNTIFEVREVQQPLDQPAAVANTTEENPMTEEEKRAAEDLIRRQAEEAERKRSLTIRQMAKKVGLADEVADDLIARGISIAEASAALIDKVAERQAGTQTESRNSQPTIVGGLDQAVLTAKREAMQNALLNRCNPTIALIEGAREFRGMRLLDLARECVETVGGNARGMLPQEVARAALGCDRTAMRAAGMQTTSDFPILLGGGVTRTLRDAYAQAPQTWRPLGQPTTVPDFRATTRAALGDISALEEVKERILEYLAVQKRVKKIRGPVLCLVGPPGVGKTSLAESIAHATNRKFVRMALGGVRDEAEIRGHRRTYIGSMPGRLIQKMTKVGVRNPLFLLDEIDKMGSDMRGDPASALLEVLDPEQNHNFNDHYLEVDYDLSDVMFLCTSNSMNIPPALLDRMEVIRLPGYTEDEKINIAVKYLSPKQITANGLKKGELEFDAEAIRDIIRYYTREAGVRGLERQIAKVCRKAVKEHALEKRFSVKVTADMLEHFLGVRKFRYGLAESQDQIGQVTGLAWTQVGGELLTIEAAVVPGKGQLIKTGSLGDVMVESITAALTVVRSRAKSLGIPLDFHEKRDTHIHMPEGATPKDGPSAGVGMCTALVSALTGIPVRADVAMTGEITLRGQVLAIGGLKEKLLAAHRGGIKTVIIPEENVRDLKEIPDNIKQDLQIKPVKWIDEVLQIALQYAPEPLPDVAPEIVAKDEKRESDSKERISTH